MTTERFHWRRCTTLANVEFAEYDFITLDVFDTIVVRRMKSPKHVWLEVADRAHTRGTLDRRVTRDQFQTLRARVEAEVRKRAQKKFGTVEVTFEEVWAGMPDTLGDLLALSAIEFEVESDACVANPYFVSFMREACEKQVPVTIVSDIYFSKSQMRALLASSGIEAELYADIYVSSERRGAKFEGKAFDTVLAQLGAANPKRVLHVGDNLLADYLQPGRRGITAIHHKSAHPSQDGFALEYMLGVHEDEDPLAAV